MRFLGIMTVPAGASRNNTNAGVRSFLDLGTLAAGNLDTVVERGVQGIAGDSWTIAATGDSAPAAGVTIDVDTTLETVLIHYESAVSTVLDVETAIAALAGDDDVIEVLTAGTPGTVLTAPGDNFAATALAGGIDFFQIPNHTRQLFFEPTSNDLSIELLVDTAYPSALVTTAARGFPIAPTALNLKALFLIPRRSADTIVAVWNANVAVQTLRIWGAGPGA
jgi:hypothetical protein